MDRALRVLVQNHRIRLPSPAAASDRPVGRDVLATLVNNLCAFGFALSRDGFEAVRAASDGAARAWWEEVEPVLMDLSGADRKMDEHVVYKNFPHEVLAMSQADYWLRQILMYWGLPNEWFTEEPVERPLLDERLRLKVLQPATPATLGEIFAELVARPARWTGEQREDALFLVRRLGRDIDLSTVAFKENMVHLAVQCLEAGIQARVGTATDVLRLAVGMSDGDVALREPSRPRQQQGLEGRACQMIDLYLDMLEKGGVRYAVWNVLCYSRISFDDAEEVFAALQWGADPARGKLFEPARCQLAFPIKGPQYTKYVAYLDLRRRQVVYIDANLRANVTSAAVNGDRLAKTMPAFIEYLDSLPSVHDVFAHLPAAKDGLPVLYGDAKVELTDGDAEAYVFRPEREANRFRPFPLQALLS